jgi:hypothetical protein
LLTYSNRRIFTTFLVSLVPPRLIRWSSDEHIYLGVAHVIQSTHLDSLFPPFCVDISLPPNSKFPDNPEATYAFQKVSVAYNVLSNPASKRVYDLHPASHEFSCNTTGSTMCAEETLRSVVVGIFNDFLDGDLEMVRTLLRKSLLHQSGPECTTYPT